MPGGGGGGGGGSGGGGATCDLSAPTAIVSGVQSGRGIAVDADFVYYVDYLSSGGATTYRVAKSGGTPVTLVTVAGGSMDVAVDAANVYVGEGGIGTTSGGIHILPKSGGAERFVGALTGLSCGDAHPRRLATVAGDLYWTQRDGGATGCATGMEIVRLPQGSAAPVTLTGADEDSGIAIFVDDTHVFWSWPGGIYRHSRITAGGTTERIDPHDADVFASDGNTLYSAYGGHTVNATTAPSVFHDAYTDPSASISGLAADATHLWIGASHLLRMDLGSGATTVVSDAPAAGPLVVDDRYVYYFDNANQILKACR